MAEYLLSQLHHRTVWRFLRWLIFSETCSAITNRLQPFELPFSGAVLITPVCRGGAASRAAEATTVCEPLRHGAHMLHESKWVPGANGGKMSNSWHGVKSVRPDCNLVPFGSVHLSASTAYSPHHLPWDVIMTQEHTDPSSHSPRTLLICLCVHLGLCSLSRVILQFRH